VLPHPLRTLLALCLTLGFSAATLAQGTPAAADAAVERLRIVGGLAGVNQFVRHEEPFWSRDLPRLTGGRASAEIVSFDRAGLRGQEMLRLIQQGVVPFGTLLLAVSAAQEPELAAPDLAGLNPDFAALRRTVAAYRPRAEALLRSRYGAELLALYVYPAQATFCARPVARLGDLAGRRIRVSSPTQADWVTALGGTPVQTTFGEIVNNLRNGNIDCAITGTMSGNTIGLHEVTTHLHPMPVSWGLAAFVANGAAWEALSAETRAVLRRELPRLESAIWAESERETGEGIACNTGSADCTSGRRGRMTLVRPSPEDDTRRREILTTAVLPGWVQRCGAACVTTWKSTLGRATGVDPF
jgi:TRAP-type C4-dicarboxylate transport system substrate-binding protein